MKQLLSAFIMLLVAASPACAGKISARGSAKPSLTGAETIGSIQGGVGKKTTVDDLASQTATILRPESAIYGTCVADNSTDCTASFQAMFAAAEDGNIILLSNGVYKISGLLTIPAKGIIIQGAGYVKHVNAAFGHEGYATNIRGSVIRQASAVVDGIHHDQDQGGRGTANVIFRDFALVGPGSGATSGLVGGSATIGLTWFTLENVGIYNFFIGFDVRRGNSNQIYNLDLRGCTTGIRFTEGHEEMTFYSPSFDFNTTHISILHGNGLSFFAPIFQDSTTAISIVPSSVLLQGFKFYRAYFEANTTIANFNYTTAGIRNVSFVDAHGSGAGLFTWAGATSFDHIHFVRSNFEAVALIVPAGSSDFVLDRSSFASINVDGFVNNATTHHIVTNEAESIANPPFAVAYNANVQLKWVNGSHQIAALTGNVSFAVPNDAPRGAILTLVIRQDGVGGRTVAFTGFTPNNWSDTGNTANRRSSITMQKIASGEWMQVGPQTPYGSVSFASLGTPVVGTTVYCSDCVKVYAAANQAAAICAGRGTGAFARRVNSRKPVWICD